ncbi:uncharacterized protein [Triticum aestivum]|uniref:uncharacterized protein isoform X1 n=1 Tax=Triticum aestivum TaxID=4565 RepID=UPI001D023FF0|nr:uncharacterized protein LOC123081824 isoform X1 [Triticum aestivum]
MLGYRADRLDAKHALPDKLNVAKHKKLVPKIRKVQDLLGNSLTGVDLIRCWIAWRVIPLSCRSGLMCNYTGGTDDPLRHSSLRLTEEAIMEMATTLINSKYEDCNIVGLNSFCKLNPTPKAKSDFWKVKYDHEAAKKARAAAIAAKQTVRKSKKKPTASELLKLDDTSESEVALDSLGLLFNHLIDTDYCQDDMGASQAVEEEVNINSSNSEPLLRQTLRRVTRKVRFSHPLAYLDPHFLLKRQQHESRRQTQTGGDDDLPSGLPTLHKNTLP